MPTYFETSSIHLATFLKMKGFTIEKLSMHDDNKRVIFHFIDNDTRKDLVKEYFENKEGFFSFVSAFNDLKVMIHNFKENV